MNININGEKKDFKDNISIKELINELDLGNKPIVIELNEEIILKEDYDRKLASDDNLEVINFVGGGWC